MIRVKLRRGTVELLLTKKNLSQNWLASKIGISSGYMSQLMHGSRSPSPKLRQKLLDYLNGLSFDDLFEIVK